MSCHVSGACVLYVCLQILQRSIGALDCRVLSALRWRLIAGPRQPARHTPVPATGGRTKLRSRVTSMVTSCKLTGRGACGNSTRASTTVPQQRVFRTRHTVAEPQQWHQGNLRNPSPPVATPPRPRASGVCGSELEQLSAGGSLAVPLDPPGVLMCKAKGKQPPRGDGSAYHTLASKHRPLTTQSHTMAIVTRPSSDTGGRVGSDTNNRNCNKRPRTARLSPAVGRPRCGDATSQPARRVVSLSRSMLSFTRNA